MIRVQLQFTEAQVDALRARSTRSGRPMAQLVREAVAAWLRDDERRARTDRALAAVGGFHSGRQDIAEEHDRYLDPGALE